MSKVIVKPSLSKMFVEEMMAKGAVIQKDSPLLPEPITPDMIPHVRAILQTAYDLLTDSEHWLKGKDAMVMGERWCVVQDDKIVSLVEHVAPAAILKSLDVKIERRLAQMAHVDPRDEKANAFCAQGAVIAAMWRQYKMHPGMHNDHRDLFARTMYYLGSFIPQEWVDAQAELNEPVPGFELRNPIRYNDAKDTTYEDVKLMFKKAIHALDE